MNDLTIERMYELEKMAISSNYIYPLYFNEWRYIKRAQKMPLKDIKEIISYLKKNIIFINEIKYTNELLIKYNCSESDLIERIKEVYQIIKYENLFYYGLLKEQKNMIKKMNKI